MHKLNADMLLFMRMVLGSGCSFTKL
jgi:hypothetical protein